MSKYATYLSLTMAMILGGSSIVAARLITDSFPVFLSQGMSLGCAVLVLVPFALIFEGAFPRLKKRDILYTFLQALAGIFLFRIFVMYGLMRTSAIEAGIITSTTPAAVALISLIFLRERIGLRKAAGILISISGIMAINLYGSSTANSSGNASLTGNILVMLAVVCEALLTIFRKADNEAVGPIWGTTIVTFFAFCLFLPVSLAEATAYDFRQVTAGRLLIVFYYGVIVTGVAFILWFKGISKVPASTAAVFTAFMPVSAVCFSCLVLRERFLPIHLVGIMLVLSGIACITILPEKSCEKENERRKLGRDHDGRRTVENKNIRQVENMHYNNARACVSMLPPGAACPTGYKRPQKR